MYLNELAKNMRMIGDERRLHIMCYLMKHGQPCVSVIAGDLGMSIATASHHLRTLAKEGFVETVRHGKRICYGLPKTPLVNGLKKFICAHADF